MTNNDKVPELTNGEFDDFVKEGTVLIDFFAEWCMPCVMMAPIVDELAEEFKGKIKVGKVNIEDNSETAQKFNVSSIPTFILFKDGQVKEQIMGAMSKDELGKVIRENL
jgi:thioredoxin 1